MPLPTNYIELKAEIANRLNRSDLTSDIPSFISFGESDINLISRLSDQERTAELSMVVNQDYLATPDGFLEGISLNYNSNSRGGLRKVSVGDLDRYKINNSSGTPS